jgi:hypothetical protein
MLARVWTRRAAAAAAALVSLGAASVAHAQDDWDPDTHRSGAGAELHEWGSDLGLHTGVVGFANIEAVDDFFIDVYLPFAFGIDGDDNARAGLGNPNVAFRYAPHMGIVRWWIGGGLGAPLNAVDDLDWQVETFAAAASMAAYNSYLWAADSFPVWLTWGVDIRVIDILSIQFSGEPILLVRVDDETFADDVELAIQNRIGAELRDDETGLGGGAHFKLVYVPTDEDDVFYRADNAQVSLEPFFAWTGETFFVRFGLLFALDKPLGPPFKDNGVFAQHGTFGGSWD